MNSKSAISNPFPATAVANRDLVVAVTIQTKPYALAQEVVAEFTPTDGVSPKAQGLAIIGDFGSGKTHLALHLANLIQSRERGAKVVYLDSPGESFMAMYRDRFLPRISRDAVRALVESYFSASVASELESSELTSILAERLRAGSIDASQAASDLGISTNRLNSALTKRLAEVTDDEQFGLALTLLRRPDFEAAVWQWLAGGEPDPALRERGIDRTLSSEADALGAIGVFAVLHSSAGVSFAVIIDELEKILTPVSASVSEKDTLRALKDFLQIMQRANSLLILCGLPDYYEILPSDTQQRIGSVVRLSPLTLEDLRSYVSRSLAPRDNQGSIDPFTVDGLATIHSLSSGNVRRMIRLCRGAFAVSAKRKVQADGAIVREVAEGEFGAGSTASVRDRVSALLERTGLRYERDFVVSRNRRSMVDLWVPASDAESPTHGIAIVILDKLLDPSRVNTYVAKAQSARSREGSAIDLYLIVSGLIPESARRKLEPHYQLIASALDPDLDSRLQGAIPNAVGRLQRMAGTPTGEVIAESLQQISRQNQAMRSALDLLVAGDHLELRMQVSAERGVRRAFGTIAGGGRDDTLSYSHPEVHRHLTRARSYVDVLQETLEVDLARVVLSDRSTDHSLFFEEVTEGGLAVFLLIMPNIIEIVEGAVRRTTIEDERRRNAVIDVCRSCDDLVSMAMRRGPASFSPSRYARANREARSSEQEAFGFFEDFGRGLFEAWMRDLERLN